MASTKKGRPRQFPEGSGEPEEQRSGTVTCSFVSWVLYSAPPPPIHRYYALPVVGAVWVDKRTVSILCAIRMLDVGLSVGVGACK